jgi:hypothetical protein
MLPKPTNTILPAKIHMHFVFGHNFFPNLFFLVFES